MFVSTQHLITSFIVALTMGCGAASAAAAQYPMASAQQVEGFFPQNYANAPALAAGQSVDGNTRGAASQLRPPCGSPGVAGEQVYSFVPPASGPYQFHVRSGFDGVLSVYDEQGNLLQCNDDSAGTAESLVNVDLVAGRRVLVVEDGYGANEGSFQVTARRTPNPMDGFVFEQLPYLGMGQVTETTTSGQPNRSAQSCGGSAGASDMLFRFRAPNSGRYRFASSTRDFDGVLELRDARTFASRGCNDDTGNTRHSELQIDLAANEELIVVQDGYSGASGSFSIAASEIRMRPEATASPNNPASLPELPLGQDLATDFEGAVDRHTTSCNNQGALPDLIFRFVAPRTGLYRFDAYLASESYAHLEVLAPTRQASICAEIAAGSDPRRRSLDTYLQQNEIAVVVLESAAGGSARVVAREIEASQLPPLHLGSSRFHIDEPTSDLPWALTCGAVPARTVRAIFTAPTSGRFVFAPIGSSIYLQRRDGRVLCGAVLQIELQRGDVLFVGVPADDNGDAQVDVVSLAANTSGRQTMPRG